MVPSRNQCLVEALQCVVSGKVSEEKLFFICQSVFIENTSYFIVEGFSLVKFTLSGDVIDNFLPLPLAVRNGHIFRSPSQNLQLKLRDCGASTRHCLLGVSSPQVETWG